ncbi:MAG TPA: sigma-70 family RNA polymerase sigma factor, partial [Planctomycetota bacterium]|nr:sigma-70 family RNA polymerase sigma factor [Planctomycetota bacterium]
ALDTWYRREHPVVHRLCAGFLADVAEADDAAQDALLRLLDGLPRWEAERSWARWRNTVVLNHCRDRLRRRAARRSAEDASVRAALPAALPAPDDVAAAREVRAVLMAALASLSPREREVFVLRDLQDEDTADVAAALGIGESSVRSLLALAHRRLRRVLQERAPGLVPVAAARSAP